LPRVRMCCQELEQVILNLIVNSRDAMGEGGTVSIRTSDETIDETVVSRFGDITPGRYVQMTVSDTGCGIPPELVDRIFDPFFTTKGSAGTGLGLSTVFGIAREAGAGIAVESQVGRGTAVSLYFPGHEEEPVAPLPEEVAVAVPGAGETVLLVEDEDRLRALTARSLRERGYLVLSAASGEHAIRMAELYREPIDLLVTDVVMPGLSGPALHRELEERRGRLPVLFASGYPGEELSRLGVGTERLLAKPFTGAALASAVREVLDEG
ncbi:MAG: ATP-binding protein, partial [Gemmatimonadota bacterium]